MESLTHHGHEPIPEKLIPHLRAAHRCHVVFAHRSVSDRLVDGRILIAVRLHLGAPVAIAWYAGAKKTVIARSLTAGIRRILHTSGLNGLDEIIHGHVVTASHLPKWAFRLLLPAVGVEIYVTEWVEKAEAGTVTVRMEHVDAQGAGGIQARMLRTRLETRSGRIQAADSVECRYGACLTADVRAETVTNAVSVRRRYAFCRLGSECDGCSHGLGVGGRQGVIVPIISAKVPTDHENRTVLDGQ